MAGGEWVIINTPKSSGVMLTAELLNEQHIAYSKYLTGVQWVLCAPEGR